MTRTDSGGGTGGPALPPRGADRAGGRAAGRAADRRSPGRVRFTGALLIMVSLIPAAVGYFVFAVWLPTDVRQYRDYVAAEPCPVHAAVARWEDCLRTVPFLVDSTVVKHGKTSTFEATLSGAPFWNGVVPFGDSEPVLSYLKPGDQVSGTVWHGRVMAVGKGGLRQSSSDAPRDEPQMTAAFGTFAGLLAALALVFGAVRLVRPGSHEPFGWRPYGRALFAVAAVACMGAGFPALWIGLPWWVVPPVAVLVVALVARPLHQHWRPGGHGGGDSGDQAGQGSLAGRTKP